MQDVETFLCKVLEMVEEINGEISCGSPSEASFKLGSIHSDITHFMENLPAEGNAEEDSE